MQPDSFLGSSSTSPLRRICSAREWYTKPSRNSGLLPWATVLMISPNEPTVWPGISEQFQKQLVERAVLHMYGRIQGSSSFGRKAFSSDGHSLRGKGLRSCSATNRPVSTQFVRSGVLLSVSLHLVGTTSFRTSRGVAQSEKWGKVFVYYVYCFLNHESRDGTTHRSVLDLATPHTVLTVSQRHLELRNNEALLYTTPVTDLFLCLT